MKREERSARKQREDQALNRVLLWFGGAVILEFFLLLLNRFYLNFDVSGAGLAYGLAVFLRGLVWVSLAATVAAGGWWAVRRTKGGKTFLPGVCALVALAILVCSAVSSLWKGHGVQLLYLAVPALAVLALIYYLYQREFFLVALQGIAALFAIWGYRKLFGTRPEAVYVIFAVAAAVTLGVVGLALLLQKNGGRLKGKQVLGKKANYWMLYLSGGVTVLSMVCALALGTTAAHVALFLVVAWLFAAAVYYTVRLM